MLGNESSLVDDICAPGGLRPQPDPTDLRRFVDTASNMDGLMLADLLREKMVSRREGVSEQATKWDKCPNIRARFTTAIAWWHRRHEG